MRFGYSLIRLCVFSIRAIERRRMEGEKIASEENWELRIDEKMGAGATTIYASASPGCVLAPNNTATFISFYSLIFFSLEFFSFYFFYFETLLGVLQNTLKFCCLSLAHPPEKHVVGYGEYCDAGTYFCCLSFNKVETYGRFYCNGWCNSKSFQLLLLVTLRWRWRNVQQYDKIIHFGQVLDVHNNYKFCDIVYVRLKVRGMRGSMGGRMSGNIVVTSRTYIPVSCETWELNNHNKWMLYHEVSDSWILGAFH